MQQWSERSKSCSKLVSTRVTSLKSQGERRNGLWEVIFPRNLLLFFLNSPPQLVVSCNFSHGIHQSSDLWRKFSLKTQWFFWFPQISVCLSQSDWWRLWLLTTSRQLLILRKWQYYPKRMNVLGAPAFEDSKLQGLHLYWNRINLKYN